jgi:hypothetical protein
MSDSFDLDEDKSWVVMSGERRKGLDVYSELVVVSRLKVAKWPCHVSREKAYLRLWRLS